METHCTGGKLVEAGHTYRIVAGLVGIPLGTVAHIACRASSEGTAAARPRPGRPPLVDFRASHRLQMIIFRHRMWPLDQVMKDFNFGLARPVSTRTVRRCQHGMCTSNYVAVTKPFFEARTGAHAAAVGTRQSLLAPQRIGRCGILK